jgi:hypothetical protein
LSWIDRTLALGATALALLSADVAVASAKAIVVKSSGPSAKAFSPGKAIADNSTVTLKAGDIVTLLDGQGTRVLKGPGTFSTTANTQTSANISTVMKNTGTRQVRTGAVRGSVSEAPLRPTNVWLVDTTKSATVCVADVNSVSLWTPTGEQGANITLTRVSDGKASPVALRPMQSVKAWPIAELPITDGAQFRVSRDGVETPVTLRFASMGPNPLGVENTIAGFVRSGCNAQLDLLIETVSAQTAEDKPAS